MATALSMLAASSPTNHPGRPGAATYSFDGVDCYAMPQNAWEVSDTLVGSFTDTLTFYVEPNTIAFGVHVILTQAGAAVTDSFRIRYDMLGKLADQTVTKGSSLIGLPLRNSAGAAVTWLDWATASKYSAYDSTLVMDFKPIGGRWAEFHLNQGLGADNDSLAYRFQFIQIPESNKTVK